MIDNSWLNPEEGFNGLITDYNGNAQSSEFDSQL